MSKTDDPIFSLKPPLKWAGGKRWLLPYLRNFWDPKGSYRLVEPFCGGLAVTLGLMPHFALLNDINPHLMNFYSWLKQGLVIQIPMNNLPDQYYHYRDWFNTLLKEKKHYTIEAASLFYYLNRTGYNGLCRFNRKGEFNVPFGKYKLINYISNFSEYQVHFEAWELSQCDLEDLKLGPKDFIYADPPYDVEFTQYSQEGFSWLDQVRTARYLAQHPGPVILSNQATPRIQHLYQDLGFYLKLLPAPRMISCTGNRDPALEILAFRNIPL
jgi:DNA adenine methylase